VWLAGLAWAFCGAAAHAVSPAAYQTVRDAVAVTRVADPAQLATGSPALAGKIVELNGVISGVISNDTTTALMLRLDGGTMLLLSLPGHDPSLDVGLAVRALVRVPAEGALLTGLAATAAGPELALAPLPPDDAGECPLPEPGGARPVNPPNEMPVDNRPRLVFHAPERLQEEPNAVTESPRDFPEIVRCYAERIRSCNGYLDGDTANLIAYHLLYKSQRFGVDPRLTFAVVMQESRFNPRAVSSAGAQGLGQLMPGTAAGLGVTDSFDIEQNLEGTVRYLSTQLRNFGRLSLALAAYNAGPNNVKRYGGVPPFRETQNYVRRIWSHYCKLVGLDPKTGEPE